SEDGPPNVFLVVGPLVIFLLLRYMPGWDISLPATVLHFYAGSFVSFVGLVAALFVASAARLPSDARTGFIALAFVAIAAIFLLHALGTPGVMMAGESYETIGWSARLSLAVGAACFGLASVEWGSRADAWLRRRRTGLAAAALALYVAYVTLILAVPDPFKGLTVLEPASGYVLGALAIALFAWSAVRLWLAYRLERPRLGRWLSLALVWLATAQVSMTLGPIWQLSWWWYHILMLAAFVVAVRAMAREFEAVSEFHPARYFAAVGSVAGIGLALVAGGVGAQALATPGQRAVFVLFAVLSAGLFFLILYGIVRRADRLITERTAALRREQHLRAELTRLLVHDLKNPLGVILGSIGPVAAGLTGDLNEAQGRFLARAESSTRDLLRLIEEVLDVERLEAGALPLDRTWVDAGALLRERAADIEGQVQQRRQHVVLAVQDPLPPLYADEGLLARVVENLLSNALKFTPEGGQIRLTARRVDDRLVVEVADSGPGVPAAERGRIFEKFARLRGARARGAGLGLTLCKMAVEAHGGRIEVEDSPDGGALFRIEFPLGRGESAFGGG
ncbi:MAG TPA: ATP-binding protein, partial [Anaerolineales bacterium]